MASSPSLSFSSLVSSNTRFLLNVFEDEGEKEEDEEEEDEEEEDTKEDKDVIDDGNRVLISLILCG